MEAERRTIIMISRLQKCGVTAPGPWPLPKIDARVTLPSLCHGH